MARNRTLTSDFWTREDVIDCSPMSRLLLLGLGNFADDHGVQPLRPRTIRMQVFPGDAVGNDDVRAMIEELQSRKLVRIYEVDGQEYFLDLLFYHLKLRCFVVIDLKIEAFKPEFAGKMNFYLSAVDAQMTHKDDQPTIGLLLCQENNRITVEYALRDVKKPIGVAQWKTKLVDSLPKNLRSALPTVEQLEKELRSK